jgi:hypothetical protein
VKKQTHHHPPSETNPRDSTYIPTHPLSLSLFSPFSPPYTAMGHNKGRLHVPKGTGGRVNDVLRQVNGVMLCKGECDDVSRRKLWRRRCVACLFYGWCAVRLRWSAKGLCLTRLRMRCCLVGGFDLTWGSRSLTISSGIRTWNIIRYTCHPFSITDLHCLIIILSDASFTVHQSSTRHPSLRHPAGAKSLRLLLHAARTKHQLPLFDPRSHSLYSNGIIVNKLST